MVVDLNRSHRVRYLNAWQQAQQAYEELLAYAQSHQLPTLVSLTLNRLAILAVQQSHDKPKVRALLEEAWRMAETSHDQKALAETGWNLAQITIFVWGDMKSALPYGEHALELARASNHKELEARSLYSLGWIHIRGGDFQEGIHCVEASLALYATLGSEPAASRELSLASFVIGAPLTQPLTNRATEAFCWALLAIAQVYAGQVQHSLRSGRRALALAHESKNVWVQINNMTNLTHGLLDAGAYEEALVLTQQTMALARTLPPTNINSQRSLMALGSTYQALQQWQEARSTLEEAVAVAERLDLGPLRVPALSQLCMNCALTGEWEQAYTYAVKAMALHESFEGAMLLDFPCQYETEALLRGGDESQARVAMQRLGERVGANRRFRLPYLRSLAVLAAWEGQSEQAIGQLREAAGLAAELGLPAEQWQIQEILGRLYRARGGHQG